MNRAATYVCSAVLAVLIIASSPELLAEQAETAAKRLALEACAERQIQSAGDKVRASEILKECSTEARAFYATLPPGLVPEYRKHIEHVIQHRLDR